MHKKLIYIAFLVFNCHCISHSESGVANQKDSFNITKKLADSINAVQDDYSGTEISDQKEDSIIDQNLLDSLKTVMDKYSRECYKIELSFSGYESESEENWYYDSLGVICGYHLTWNMEGQSGESFHWYENGKLLAMYDETQGNSGDPDITFLTRPTDAVKLKSYDNGAKSMEQKIFKMINDNPEKKSIDEYSISVSLEETVNYGAEYVQNTTIYIDKPLYGILFNQK